MRLQDVLKPDYEDFYLRKWLKGKISQTSRQFFLNEKFHIFTKIHVPKVQS